MAHEIDMQDGTIRYAFNGMHGLPWHKLGTPVDGNQSLDAMLVAAHMDYQMRLQRTFIRNLNNTETREAIEVPRSQAVVRGDSGMPVCAVGADYKLIQIRETFDVFTAALDGRAVWCSMGVLKEGREVFGLAEIPGDWRIAGEQHRRFLLALGYFDGIHANHWLSTDVRVVCANTQARAIGAASGAKDGTLAAGTKVAHRGDVKAKLDSVGDVFTDALAEFNGHKARMESLAAAKLTRDDEIRILETVIDGDSKRAEKARGTILHLAHAGRGNAGIAGTAYGLLQGTTEYVDHSRMQDATAEKQFLYQTQGAGSRLKARMEATLVRELSGANVGTDPNASGSLLDAILSA